MSTLTTTSDLAIAVAACRRRQSAWGVRAVRERIRHVSEFRRLLVRAADELTEAIGRDVGKSAEEALAGDVLPLADACLFLERQAARLLRPQSVSTSVRPLWLWGQSDVVHRRPRGVVGIIGTWNYPLLLNGVQLMQALTAGNAVVWKPSELAAHSAAVVTRLLREAGFPQDLIHVMPATRDGGAALAEADVDHVVFTGSSTTGRVLAANLGRRLVSSTLELSGCDAMFVLDDADPALAARAAWFGATLNRGQTCLAVRRALVSRKVYGPFLEALRPLAEAARPMKLALPSQVEQAVRLVEDAIQSGAKLLGSDPVKPTASEDECRPTAVLEARPEMALCREASFAPLLAVMPFDDLEEALNLEKPCPYALGASVFTRTPLRAERLAEWLRAGAVTVNDVVVPTAHPATPFGGRGESGWGVTQGSEGLLEMTLTQVVSVRTGTQRPHYDMVINPKDAQGELLRALLQATHGETWWTRLTGIVRTVRAAWKQR